MKNLECYSFECHSGTLMVISLEELTIKVNIIAAIWYPWQINEETMETVTDFVFLGSKFTADGDYSHEIKRHLLFGRKAVT